MKFKTLTLILVAVCLLMSLTACSENAKPEQDISNEIKQCFQNDFAHINFDNVTVEITQRQTNKNDKTDYVWASVFASNEDLQYVGNYSAMYALYNDGWVLEYCDWDDGQFSLLRSTVTEAQAENAVWNEQLGNYPYLTLVNRNTELYYGEDIFYFEGQYSDDYLTIVDTIKVQYSYNYGISEWELDSIECISSDEIWNVLGKWEYNNGGDSMWLYIHEISNNTVSIEFDFDYTSKKETLIYGLQKEDRHYVSNGIQTREWSITSFSGESIGFALLDDNDKSCWINISKTHGLTFDDNLAKSDDEYYFIYAGK